MIVFAEHVDDGAALLFESDGNGTLREAPAKVRGPKLDGFGRVVELPVSAELLPAGSRDQEWFCEPQSMAAKAAQAGSAGVFANDDIKPPWGGLA